MLSVSTVSDRVSKLHVHTTCTLESTGAAVAVRAASTVTAVPLEGMPREDKSMIISRHAQPPRRTADRRPGAPRPARSHPAVWLRESAQVTAPYSMQACTVLHALQVYTTRGLMRLRGIVPSCVPRAAGAVNRLDNGYATSCCRRRPWWNAPYSITRTRTLARGTTYVLAIVRANSLLKRPLGTSEG